MGMTSPTPAESGTDPIAVAFAREERSGLAYALWGRLIVLGALLLFTLTAANLERTAFYAATIVAFMAFGVIPYLMRRQGFTWIGWTIGFMLFEVAVLTYLLVVPAPFYDETWTPQVNLRAPNFLYLGIFLVGVVLSYSPALVVWTGAATILGWSVGMMWIVSLPDSIATTAREAIHGPLSPHQQIELFLSPNYVALTIWYNQLAFLGLVTLILAVTVWRSRRLVRRQVVAESQRANLSRYFSPNLVDELAAVGAGIDRVTSQKVAVLFADMVGFTALSENMAPEAVIALLRDFHGRLARTIFAHGGTLDKYIGDAVMAHFGTPRPMADDAGRALACGLDMVREIEAWNTERADRGERRVQVGIGIHYGPVVAGNIGDERRLEYTVLGDTVNVASRIEALTREANSPLLASEELITAIRAEDPDADRTILKSVRADRDRTVRGRRAPVSVWVFDPDPTPTS